MKKLSLIVPIYGVEKYIHKFLGSLEKNLLPGVEVLLIDDGTKDDSGKIADEFALMHPQYVRVVHKENGGLSSARNKGLEIAQGEYVIFPDPDDYLADDYVETILKAIEEYNAPDMIFFDYYVGTCKDDFKRNTVPGFIEGVISKESFIKEHIKDSNIKGMVWFKAIKKSFYDGLWFNKETRVAEDYELLTDLVPKLENIVYIPKPLYYYIYRENSLTNTANFADSLRMFDLVLDRYKKHSRLFKDVSDFHLIKTAIGILIRVYTQGSNIETKRFEEIIKEHIKNIIFNSDFSINEKKQCLFIYFGLAQAYYGMKYGKVKK